MTFKTKYINFATRVSKEFLSVFVIVTSIALFSYLNNNRDFETISFMILGFGAIYFVVSVIDVWTFVYGVKIMDDKIIVTGSSMDNRWDMEFVIKHSDIKIRSKGRGRGNVEYFLRLSSPGKSVDINRSFNWDYPSLLTIFHEFKRIKGEKIIFDEKYFLDLMEKNHTCQQSKIFLF